MVLHRLLQRSDYVLAPQIQDLYRMPKSTKIFLYASLELDAEENKKSRRMGSNPKANVKRR